MISSKQSLSVRPSELSTSTDLLSLGKEPRLLTQLQSDQKIIYSCWIQKYNENNKCQARIFLLTDHAIYNIIKSDNFIKTIFSKLVDFENKYIIRRKMPFHSIEAITLSNLEKNQQFIIHIHNDYDYRFHIPDLQMKINLIKSVCLQYEKQTKKKMKFYFVDDVSLRKYCTFKGDIKNKAQKKPKISPVHLNVEDLVDYQRPGAKFKLVFSKDKDIVEIEQFKSSSLEIMKGNRKYFSLQNLQLKFDQIESKLANEFPFIILPSYCFQTDSNIYLLRPLMIGGILENIIKESGPFNKKLTTFYLAQIILTLEFLHERKWIYRSLSLGKIYLKSNGYIAIEGLCKSMTVLKETKKYDLYGNLSSLPPEAILCQGYDEKIDIWCLGLLGYQMIYGHHPYAVENTKSTIFNILKLEIEQTQMLPGFVHSALSKSPQNRISLNEIKKDEWFEEIDWEKLKKQEMIAPYVPESHKLKEWQGKLPTVVYLEQKA